jgi:hypothetical protein
MNVKGPIGTQRMLRTLLEPLLSCKDALLNPD